MSQHSKELTKTPKNRHVLGISGSKDSTAFTIYIKDHHPDLHEKVEYFFTDIGAELIKVKLNKAVKSKECWQDKLRLNSEDNDPEDQACVICSL